MSEKILSKINKLRKEGMSLLHALEECKVDHHKYYQYARAGGIEIRNTCRSRTYNKKVVKAVQKRIATGEYLKHVCKDMGLDPRNLSRFCRMHGILLYSPKAMALNNKLRGVDRRGSKHVRKIAFIVTSRVPKILGMLFYGMEPEEIAIEFDVNVSYVTLVGNRYFPDWEDYQLS